MSLYDALVQGAEVGKSILADLEPLRSDLEARHLSEEEEVREGAWREILALHAVVAETLPAQIPAFEGSLVEYEYLRPSRQVFEAHLSLGDAEDRLFFGSGLPLARLGTSGMLPPWIRMTWDHGGCLRFGEYQWAAEYRRIGTLRESVSRPLYRELADDFERVLAEEVTAWSEAPFLCVCEGTGAVASDLEALRDAFQQTRNGQEIAMRLSRILARLQSGGLKIQSEAAAHCSGG